MRLNQGHLTGKITCCLSTTDKEQHKKQLAQAVTLNHKSNFFTSKETTANWWLNCLSVGLGFCIFFPVIVFTLHSLFPAFLPTKHLLFFSPYIFLCWDPWCPSLPVCLSGGFTLLTQWPFAPESKVLTWILSVYLPVTCPRVCSMFLFSWQLVFAGVIWPFFIGWVYRRVFCGKCNDDAVL